MASKEAQAALVDQLVADPTESGYLTIESDDPAWNVFNMLRDPAKERLVALSLQEGEFDIKDVRAALMIARALKMGV